jgi:hypothetical protein
VFWDCAALSGVGQVSRFEGKLGVRYRKVISTQRTLNRSEEGVSMLKNFHN